MWTHTSFYRFTDLADPEALAAHLRGRSFGTDGSVWLSSEGISGVVSGQGPSVDAFERSLREDAIWGGALSDLDFKRSQGETRPFTKFRVHVRPALVTIDVPRKGGASRRVTPEVWRQLLDDPSVVLIDNRNHFEFRLGRFRGAIDPGVHTFDDFRAYVEANAASWRGRPVAMYCTGGIRCERTGPWMAGLGLDVIELDGGILNYFREIPDAERDWEGECFVFDNRIAITPQLTEATVRAEEVFADDPARLARATRLRAYVDEAC